MRCFSSWLEGVEGVMIRWSEVLFIVPRIDGQAGGTMMILAQILHILVVPNLTSGNGENQVGFCDARP